MDHWLIGYGSGYNPIRKRAFEIVRLVKDIEDIKRQTGAYMVGTSATKLQGSLSWTEARRLASERDLCLLFGTGWGIAPGMLGGLDAVIEPIEAGTGFNHLSVRSAASIAIDRIVGR